MAVNIRKGPLLNWTGHPLADVGVATICAMTNKSSPEELLPEDLDRAADEMADYYFSGIMSSYNSCVFTINAYDNPTSLPKKKNEYENRVLRAHRYPAEEGAGLLRCVFSGQYATHLIERRQMPMITGENVINFFPAGRGGMPIAGPYLVALQALPLGGRRVEGKLLIVHSDFPEFTLAFARQYMEDNRRIIGLFKAGHLPAKDGPSPVLEREQGAWDSRKKCPKFPDAKSAQSLIAADLMKIWEKREDTRFGRIPVSITAYWLSNSGQGPSLDVFHLPAQITRFLLLSNQSPLGDSWRTIVVKGWCEPQEKAGAEPGEDGESGVKKNRKVKKAEGYRVPGGPGRSRNNVLAELFAVYENGFIDLHAAKRFLRRYLLRDASSFVQGVKGRPLIEEEWKLFNPGLVHWPLASLFLKEVMGVDERYISNIRQFSDRMAEYIDRVNDKAFFRNIVYADKPWKLRNALVKAQRNQAREQNDLLFGLQDYLDVFEADEFVGRGDWSLVRDLVSIRLVEQLYVKKFFEKEGNKDLLGDADESLSESQR